ncbi:hypothetical protein D9M68_665570 [compost metagenome]
MLDLDIGARLQQFARQMAGAAVPTRTVVQLAGVLLRVIDQVGQLFDLVLLGELDVHHQHVGHRGHDRDRREVLHRVVRQVGEQPGVDRVGRDCAHHQRIAVGRRLRHEVGPDIAARARAVFHDDGLAQGTAHLLGQHAGHGVQRAAGRVRHDEAQRLGREISGLRQGRRAERQGCGQRNGALQQGAAHGAAGGRLHVVFSSLVSIAVSSIPQGGQERNKEKPGKSSAACV